MITHRMIPLGISLVMLSATPEVFAQEAPPPASQPTEAPKDTPPSLDELLGVDKEKGGDAGKSNADAAARDNNEELKRQLNEAEVADAFEQAIQKMTLSATLLDNQFDTGLGTQRVQEDIIAKLAQLIDNAKKSKSQSSKSSSSKSSSQSKQQQSDPASKNTPPKNEGQAKQNSTGDKRNSNPSDSREGDPPELQQGDVNTVIDETRSEWGNLPQRVREMLMQGRKEKFSSLYQQLTQEYYKRLAEENAP